MCGIIGYIGNKQALPILMEGLDRLSYRGYDSTGIATLDDEGKVQIRKAKGRLENLSNLIEEQPIVGKIGIGHTRWATHGEPSDLNAHPHTDVKGGIAVVHNGIIENHEALRSFLEGEGAVFVSETDTEVIAHLLNHLYDGNMQKTILHAMSMLEGSYALIVISDKEPGVIYCAKNDSPLIIGVKEDECYIASDIPALLNHTRNVIFLDDKEIAVVKASGSVMYDEYGNEVQHEVVHVEWDLESAEKGGYPHYMLKEIFEQPEAFHKAFSARYTEGVSDHKWFPISVDEVKALRKITVVACGTASFAGQMGKYAIEKLARIPVEAEIGSEYRYKEPIIGENELFIAISQSGETADTLAALREAKRRGAKAIAICNAVGSTISREVGEKNTLYTYAGPEIAVASTKAYVTQVELMLMIAMELADMRGVLSAEQKMTLIESFKALPTLAKEALEKQSEVQRFVSTVVQKKHAFFVGRGMDYALSMEAALKLKEISYIFSESYAAGELKHGPIALIQEGRLVVAIITQPHLLDKSMSNLREVEARGARIMAVCTSSLADRVKNNVETLIVVPDIEPMLAPLLAIIPLQLFAYEMAISRGCDVDKPRNLAKSVTVE